MSKERLRDAARSAQVTRFLDYREFLGAVFAAVKGGEDGYSYYRFAEDLGCSRTNVLWLVLNNRRRLTSLTAERVAEGLGLSGLDRRYFGALVKHNNARAPAKREALLARLLALKARELPSTDDRDKLDYFSEWYHPVIREMVGIQDFQLDEAWIGPRLYSRLTPKEIHHAIELLRKLGLIAEGPTPGSFVPAGGQVRTNRLASKLVAIRYHEKMLDIAKESLTRVPQARREYNTVTLCVSEDVAVRIKELIRELCSRAMDLEQEAAPGAKQVYQLNVQLFPFTKAR